MLICGMNDEINEIIKKNLPAQVGDVLKQRLEQAEVDAVKVQELTAKVAERDAIIKDQKDKLSKYATFDEISSGLTAREEALKISETNFKVSVLEYQLQSEKDKTDFAKNVALGLVRNTEYRRTLSDNKSSSGYSDHSGNWIQPPNSYQNSEENNKAE